MNSNFPADQEPTAKVRPAMIPEPPSAVMSAPRAVLADDGSIVPSGKNARASLHVCACLMRAAVAGL